MPSTPLELLTLLPLGLLAGEELAVCVGVRPAFATLEDSPGIRLRQTLIRRLRLLVPLILLPAFGGALTVALRDAPGGAWRWAAVGALALFLAVTFLGTVPINKAALEWDPSLPPCDWKARVALWERLDVVRCLAALAAFAFVLLGLAGGVRMR